VVHPDQVNAEALRDGLRLGAAAGPQLPGRNAVQGGVAVGDCDNCHVVAALAMARQGAAHGELRVAGTGSYGDDAHKGVQLLGRTIRALSVARTNETSSLRHNAYNDCRG